MLQGSMSERTLGADGLKVSAIGLGCMGMSEFYDPKQMDDAESIRSSIAISTQVVISSIPPTCTAAAGTKRWSAAASPADATRLSWRRSLPTSAGLMASFSGSAATPST